VVTKWEGNLVYTSKTRGETLFFSADWCCLHCMHLQVDTKVLADFCGEAGGEPRDIQDFCASTARKKIQVFLVQHRNTNLGCHNF